MLDFLGVTSNFASIAGTPLKLRWAFTTSNGSPCDLHATLITGAVYSTGQTHPLSITPSPNPSEAHILIVEIPALPEGRWQYETHATSDGAERQRLVAGYISVLKNLETAAPTTQEPTADRTLLITLPDQPAEQLRLRWLANTTATAAATQAKASATQAKTSETNAQASETNASAHATTATTAATTATASATTATTKANTATTKASESATSATNAKTSETNAKTSETNAKASETKVADSATAATTAATNAKASETNATTAATTASTKATTATNAATTATASATQAKTSETNAKTSETLSKTSETSATSSAANANTAASTATEKATIATNAATTVTDLVATFRPGQALGVATLDEAGRVPAGQLPSYVDDVMEFATKSLFPSQGEQGKMYIETSTDKVYRWSGSMYVLIANGNLIVTNSLTSSSTTDALSAAMGKQLGDRLATIPSGGWNGGTVTANTTFNQGIIIPAGATLKKLDASADGKLKWGGVEVGGSVDALSLPSAGKIQAYEVVGYHPTHVGLDFGGKFKLLATENHTELIAGPSNAYGADLRINMLKLRSQTGESYMSGTLMCSDSKLYFNPNNNSALGDEVALAKNSVTKDAEGTISTDGRLLVTGSVIFRPPTDGVGNGIDYPTIVFDCGDTGTPGMSQGLQIRGLPVDVDTAMNIRDGLIVSGHVYSSTSGAASIRAVNGITFGNQSGSRVLKEQEEGYESGIFHLSYGHEPIAFRSDLPPPLFKTYQNILTTIAGGTDLIIKKTLFPNSEEANYALKEGSSLYIQEQMQIANWDDVHTLDISDSHISSSGSLSLGADKPRMVELFICISGAWSGTKLIYAGRDLGIMACPANYPFAIIYAKYFIPPITAIPIDPTTCRGAFLITASLSSRQYSASLPPTTPVG